MVAEILQKQKGQAIFELIVFLPLFLYMTKVMFDYGDAINHSINQNKVVRGYYFYTISNDSNAPNLAFSNDFYNDGGLIGPDAVIGQDSYAWSVESTLGGQKPKGSCVKVPGFMSSSPADSECLESTEIVDKKTSFIRSYSAFGVCTGSWTNIGAPSSPNLYTLRWTSAASVPCNRAVGP